MSEEKTSEELAAEFVKKFLETSIDDAANSITWTDTETADHKKIPAQESKEKFKQSLRESFYDKKLEERTQKGYQEIINHLGNYSNDRLCLKELETAAEMLQNSIKESFEKNLEKAKTALESEENFQKCFEEIQKKQHEKLENPYPKSLAEQWNISDSSLETFFDVGVKLFDEGKLEEAISVFTYLSIIDGYNHGVWFNLAMCLHQAKELDPALQAYGKTIELNPTNPLPFLYSIDVFLTLDDKANAEKALYLAEQNVNDENKDNVTSLLDHYRNLVLQHA